MSPLGSTVKIADISSLMTGKDSKVGVKCKVVKVGDLSTVKKSGDGKELKKQDIMIGDDTGSCRLVLWDDDVNSLEKGKSYCLVNLGVRMYNSTKYLCYRYNNSNVVYCLREVMDLTVTMRNSSFAVLVYGVCNSRL